MIVEAGGFGIFGERISPTLPAGEEDPTTPQ
jgi:hypothetical protein